MSVTEQDVMTFVQKGSSVIQLAQSQIIETIVIDC